MIKKIKNIGNAGLSQEEHEKIKLTVSEDNKKTLQSISFLVGIIMFVLFCATFFPEFSILVDNKYAYLLMSVASLMICGICRTYLRENIHLTNMVFYIFLITVMIFGIYIGVLTNVNQRGSTICVLLIAIPLLIIDKPHHVSLLLSISAVSFCFMSYRYKSHELFVIDSVNCFCILLISIAVNNAQQYMKYRTIHEQYMIEQYQGELIEAQKDKLEKNKISIMLSQIQPHFLYNTLEGIGELCLSNPKYAEKAVIELACYLRGNFSVINNQNLVIFEQELAHVKHYVYCEKMRFDERLRVNYDIEATEFLIPPLSLQPIVENAIRHGVSKKEEGGTVTISTRETENEWQISIRDDGIGFSDKSMMAEERKHIGIENVKTRLREQCGGMLEIHSEKGVGTKAMIHLPKN